MDCKRITRLIVGLFLICTLAPAQFGDYEWARGLTREYAFDDMAEKVFNDLLSGPGRTGVEKQQGRLGLAEMKQLQARTAGDLETALVLFEEARTLMQGAVKDWPEKNTLEYYQAIFSLADLLQERGEMAMNALTQGKVDAAKAESITRAAEADYGRAELELKKVKVAMGEPDPEDELNRPLQRVVPRVPSAGPTRARPRVVSEHVEHARPPAEGARPPPLSERQAEPPPHQRGVLDVQKRGAVLRRGHREPQRRPGPSAVL